MVTLELVELAPELTHADDSRRARRFAQRFTASTVVGIGKSALLGSRRPSHFEKTAAVACGVVRSSCDPPAMPGAMTIKEVVECMEAGADIVKIFPGELFGPKIIKAIRGPIPYAPMMPTGGVSLDNVEEWIKAGAVAVGAGSSLIGGAKKGDYASITATAKQFIEKIQAARG